MFVVITGGPSVGKTTIISQLKQRGYQVIDEQATKIIKEGVYLPWVDVDSFQKEVFRRQLDVETPHIMSNKLIFLDRGAFDGEAYYEINGMVAPKQFAALPGQRYKLALLIEELPFFDNNGVRFEDLEFTRRITPLFEKVYSQRGIAVERIPAMPPEERIELVLKVVNRYMPLHAPKPVIPAAPSLAFAR